MSRKILLFFTALAMLYNTAVAQSVEPKVLGEYSIHFRWNKWAITDDTQHRELIPLLKALEAHPDAKVDIVGWADPTGTIAANRIVSTRRAQNVAAYLIQEGFPAGQISTQGAGVDTAEVDYAHARRAAVTVRILVEVPAPEPAIQPELELEPEPEPEPAPEPEPVPAPEPVPEPAPALGPVNVVDSGKSGEFALRTNALYWVGALPNIGVEWRPVESVGVVVNGGYVPWGSDAWGHNWGGWFISPEVRIYLGKDKSWFVGPQFLAGGFNLKPGRVGYQGNVVTGGVMGGYRIQLSRCWDIDFSLGMGYCHFEYDTYRRSDSKINVYEGYNVKKNIVLPIQAGINFIWKIN